MSSSFRFAVAALLMLSTALLLQARGRQEFIPPREGFASFPDQLGNWTGTDIPIPPETLAVLGPGDFLQRDYQKTMAENPPVGLFLAYFPSQRSGDTIHSPKHCLPGGGWFPLESSVINISLPGQGISPVNLYLVANGDQRALVIYWFRSRDRVLASEYAARFYLFADSLRFNRSDGSLIRVSTLLPPQESVAAAQVRLISLLTMVTPVLDRYIPR